ncbi:GPW/gp25 family protein [Cloacibacillus evryensis]|uniref:GPW/gp25 family protein n=1 Tax=Cloacibacillus evryensis TaxID=508460 RepID=UPI0004BA9999|nr:GPW/gp25 family protein [Cloacibacillus evryensis]MEA5034039.1 hypothetical protein [Cloacibacillus evryensis]
MLTNELEVMLDGKTDIFGAIGLQNIHNCLNAIASTRIGSVPLYRHFGTDWEWVDKPEPYAMAKYRADLMEAIDKYEPRIKVISISFRRSTADAFDGKLYPIVRFKIREGVEI